MTRGLQRIGLPEYFWLVETNTNVASACIKDTVCATTFVGPLGMAASFNRTSWRLKGTVLGNEMRALTNIHGTRGYPAPIGLTGFGPNINIARDPRFGRNSELAGEDPLLSGSYAFEMVSGMQEKDKNGYMKMAAFLKHFTAYSTEANRGHDTYNISTFDFFDTYLPQYARAFKADPVGVMCSYNAENGRPSCANDWLLNKQLRSWKPDAMVATDCGAINNLKGPPVNAKDDAHAAAYALMNGTDLEMGDTQFNSLDIALKQGLISEERLNEAVRRSFKVHFEVGRFDPPELSEWKRFDASTLNSSVHQDISYEAALQGLVLLKNDAPLSLDAVLPIKQGSHIAVVGPQGVTRSGLLSDYAADQICHSGDDHCIWSVAQGVAAANIGGKTTMAQGVEVNSAKADGIAEALQLATAADVVVLALGIDKSIEQEGRDRSDTALPGLQSSFAQKVLALNKPTVLVLTNGGALAIDELLERPQQQGAAYAIVEAFSPNVLGGKAIGASLFGLENRWGKLPITMCPHQYIKDQSMVNYDMSAAPGRTYKYYKDKPLFHFGFGLSLTNFKFQCTRQQTSVAAHISIGCNIQNTGKAAGDEVLQVYHVAQDIGKVDHPLPLRALVDFQRISIQAGDEQKLEFSFTQDVFKVINAKGVATLYPGKHQLIISNGKSKDEVRFDYTVPATSEAYFI
eukprot:TRINITY_DN7028_c0_g1_i4.p1 TRINITY_DN7028_c0_g1~~TRINITY_DN7028_c0_g1_i4.p1  ORF type:complete len:798 (-),score=154.29 TRINITY_DN7028_c0_g1_i4:175-2232(-)